MFPTPAIDASRTAPELTLTEPDAAAMPDPASVLVCLPPLAADALEAALAAIAAAFPAEEVHIASPGHDATSATSPGLQMLPYPGERTASGWVLTAADYAAAASMLGDNQQRAILLLGGTAASIRPELLREFADRVRRSNDDLVLPRFTLAPGEGLVNSAILYPLTRALFGADIRFPLPIDAALSTRMVQRLASSTRHQLSLGQGPAPVWPVAEAAVAGFAVCQIDLATGPPAITRQDDFSTLFNNVAGSLFADIETKASFWQRARSPNPRPPAASLPPFDSADAAPDIQPMIESFHLAQANLQEIWALVLPPQSRLALKKLALEPAQEFALVPDLWARIVYDFVLAFHLRTLNRGHLLGALIPLYLAWVASHLRAAANDPARALRHTDETAAAFETEKPYLVSRWRWPDRFNP